ncbi:MAG: cupin domain-containing protein [Cellvibrionaceae bacterium]|nr:cupin domain-containing protein [Cellvibrionaceae bacterium]
MSSITRLPKFATSGETRPIKADKVIVGKPIEQVHNLYTNNDENFFCGVWSSDSGKWRVQYQEDEFCYLIDGEAILTDAQGNSERLNAGDAFVIPAGFEGSWETLGKATKFYAIYEK